MLIWVVAYQSVDDLHTACPGHNLGDWCFTGNYPTPGGNKVANKAFVGHMEGGRRTGLYLIRTSPTVFRGPQSYLKELCGLSKPQSPLRVTL